MKRRDTGILGEKLAQEFLREQGYRILETNYRCSEGEVDIIAHHGEFLVFVEVRTKRSLQYGSPEESVTPAKMEKLKTVAARYRQTHPDLPPSWRIDVVAIEIDRNDKPLRVELIENAVEET